MAGDDAAVAHHHDAVGDLGDLVQPVADIDEGHAFRLELADLLEQQLRLLAAKCGGRFVEDQKLGIERQRLGDLDLLLGGDAQRAHLLFRRDSRGRAASVGPMPARSWPRGRCGRRASAGGRHRRSRRPTDPAAASVPGGSCRCRRRSPRRARRGNTASPASIMRRLGLGRPGDDVRNGGLAGAVFAKQRHDLSRPHLEARIGQDLDRPVALAEAADGEPRCGDCVWLGSKDIVPLINNQGCLESGMLGDELIDIVLGGQRRILQLFWRERFRRPPA